MFKSMICLFDGNDEEMSALATAARLAGDVRGRVDVLHISYLSDVLRGRYAGAASSSGWVSVIDRHREEIATAAQSLAGAMFEREGLAVGDGAPGGRFVRLLNASNAELLRTLSLADLVVVGAATESTDVIDRTPVDLALFTARRPLLVVRPADADAPADIVGARTVVAWDGSLTAIRALVGTMPILAGQQAVTLVTAGEGVLHAPEPALAYLAAHGVAARAEHIHDDPPARAIIRRAHALRAGLLVSGAYGHSVVRERLLGGFTDTLLAEADLPLVLVH
jgi:nucleotide-binding universal stress UspA family protein